MSSVFRALAGEVYHRGVRKSPEECADMLATFLETKPDDYAYRLMIRLAAELRAAMDKAAKERIAA